MVKSKPYHEVYRPQFHFTAKKNWLNDPNGLVYYQGEYHLFFPHDPSGIDRCNKAVWGHAASSDVVNWKQLAEGIAPFVGLDSSQNNIQLAINSALTV